MPVEPLLNRRWGFDTNCFVCNEANPRGIRVPYFHDTDAAVVFADFTLPAEFSGAPTYVHGGATLALLDEGMSWATIAISQKFAFTKHTQAEFEWPVRVGWPYRLEARVVDETERSITTEAAVQDAKGRPCVKARATMAVLSVAQAIDAIGTSLSEDDARFLR